MRVLRPYVIAAIAAFALLAATPAWATPKITSRIATNIVATWRCQDQLGVPRTEARDPWKPHSKSFREAELGRWVARRGRCLQKLHARAAIWRRLEAGLAGTPMAGSGRALEAAGRRWDVNPALIAGIAGTESTFGEAACSSNRYNAFGLASCGSWGRTPVPSFESWAEAYDFEARYLTGRTSITSGWPSASSPYDLTGYAACSACWAATTAGHMERFGLGISFRYPAQFRQSLL